MNFLSNEEFERETIRLARAGSYEAGCEALRLCRDQLTARSLSPLLADYLADRLHDVLEGITPNRIITSDDYRQAVLNGLLINKPNHKPFDTFPEWELPLGALAAILFQRGYRPTDINAALSDARHQHQSKYLDTREARRIRKTYSPMQNLNESDLMRIAEKYGEILKDYPPFK